MDRFERSVREDIALVHMLKNPAEAAAWVHRIVGGMRVFGNSGEAAWIERLEHELRGTNATAAMRHLPEMIQRVERYLGRLREALDASRSAESMLKN